MFWLLHWPTIPPLLSLSAALSNPPYNNIEIRLINNPTVASKGSGERKNHMTLGLNEKLEMIKLSEEVVCWKPR